MEDPKAIPTLRSPEAFPNSGLVLNHVLQINLGFKVDDRIIGSSNHTPSNLAIRWPK